MQRVSIIFVFAFLSPHIHAAEQTDDRETETQQSRKYRRNFTEPEIQNTGILGGTKSNNETQIEELKKISEEEMRRQISEAIVESSRLLVALKTEVDRNIKETKENIDEDHGQPLTYAMYLRKGLSKILGFKIALLKFLSFGSNNPDEDTSSISTNANTQTSTKQEKKKTNSSKNNSEKDLLENWLKPKHESSSNCDVVVLVKRCKVKSKLSANKNFCKYVPVNKNCHSALEVVV